MAGAGVIIQPSYGMLRVADHLSTKVSVNGITAANMRERDRFLLMCKQVDKSKGITSSEIDFRKNIVQLHMSRIQRRAHEQKERRRKEEERRKAEEEERERRKQKAKAKSVIAFGQMPIQLAADESTSIDADALAGLIDVLDVSGENEEDGDGQDGEDSQQRLLPDVTTDHRVSLVISRGSSRERRTKSSHRISKNETGDAKRKGLGLLKRISKANMLIRTLTKLSIIAPTENDLAPVGSANEKTSSTRNFTPERLKGLLHKVKESESDAEVSETRLLLEALRRSALLNSQETATDPRVEKIRQLVSQSSFGISHSRGRLGTPSSDSIHRDKLVARLRKIPKQMPAMHQCGPLPFRQRVWERHDALPPSTDPSEKLWEDVRYCQYVRYTTKYPLVEDLAFTK